MDIDKVLRTLEKEVKNYKVPVAELVEAQTKEPFNVLLATILAARTNDKTTTAVVKKLFKEVKHPKDLRRLSEKDVQDLIYPVGFYRNKARQLKQLGEMLDSKEIPETMDGLLELPVVYASFPEDSVVPDPWYGDYVKSPRCLNRTPPTCANG